MKKKLFVCFLLFVSGPIWICGLTAPKSGVGLRLSSFGVPDALLDLLLFEHPSISGNSYAFEIRSFGERGPKSTFSAVYGVEYSRLTGEGDWRVEQYHRRVYGNGRVSQLNLTASIILNILPQLPIHPYIGGGIGVGRISIWAEGVYQDDLGTRISETYLVNKIIPVGHLPVGIVATFADKLEIRAEAGFKNGFYFGAALSYLL